MAITPNAFGIGCLGGRMNHCFLVFYSGTYSGAAVRRSCLVLCGKGKVSEIAPLEMEVWGSALIFHDQHYYLVNTSLSWAGRSCEEYLYRLMGKRKYTAAHAL